LIEAAYATPPKAPTKLTTTSRFKAASAARTARFNADIERWLQASHAVVPILVAYRAPDLEAGGTAFSAWHDESVKQVKAILAKLGTSGAERRMRDGIARTIADADPVKIARQQADAVSRPLMNAKWKGSLDASRQALTEITSKEAWWVTADEIADGAIVCFRHAKLLASAPARAIVLEVFLRALDGDSIADHERGFQFWIDAGYQPWRLPRILAVAVETALRHGDGKALRHFIKGLGATEDQRSELERCAAALDEEGLVDFARAMRRLVPLP